MPPSRETIQGFLYAQHVANLSAREAYYKLRSVTGDEIFTLKQVKELFETFKSREFTMSDQQFPTDEQLQLPYILQTVPNGVLTHCNLNDRIALRKLSHQCRDIIDGTKFEINKLTLKKTPAFMQIIADSTTTEYQKIGNGLLVTNGKWNVLLNEELLPSFERDLKTILANSKLEIGELNIVTLRLTDAEETDFLNMILSSFPNERTIIRKISVQEPRVFERILPILNRNQLVTIEMVSDRIQNLYFTDDFCETEQWKKAKELITNLKLSSMGFVPNFRHFDYCDFILENDNIVLVEELVWLKDAFILRPTFQKFEIIPTNNHSTTDQIFHTPPREFLAFRDEQNPELYKFQYPNHPTLTLLVTITRNSVLYKGPCYSGDKIRIPRRRGYVPADGEIVVDDHVDE